MKNVTALRNRLRPDHRYTPTIARADLTSTNYRKTGKLLGLAIIQLISIEH